MSEADFHPDLRAALYDDIFSSLGPNVQTLLRAMDIRAVLIAETAAHGPESSGALLAKSALRSAMLALYGQFGKPSN